MLDSFHDLDCLTDDAVVIVDLTLGTAAAVAAVAAVATVGLLLVVSLAQMRKRVPLGTLRYDLR